jgi:hypothetical protein
MHMTNQSKLVVSLIVISLLFIQTFCFAQQTRRRQVLSIAPRLGVNISDFNGDVANNNIQLGFSGGAMLTYSVVNTFGISVEALYSQKGAKFENAPVVVNNSTQRMNFNRRINYIEVPVLARYFLNKNGDFRPNLFIGPDFGFKLSAKDVNRELTTGTEQPDADISSAINPVDVGITGGIGLNFSVIESTRFLIDARYTYGLTDITEAAGNISNSAITLTFGVSFGIGKKYVK